MAMTLVGWSAETPLPPISEWTATGTAFHQRTAEGPTLRRLEIEDAGDPSVITSEMEDDGPTGTLTSPEFVLGQPFLAFRIGGGNYEWSTALLLLIDDKVVHQSTGWRSDHLTPATWDLRPWSGKKAKLRLVDHATGDWGHINVSRLRLTDSPEVSPAPVAALYQEALRPQFHFTARQWTVNHLNPGQREEGWINDLNGLIYHAGEFHLFAQRWAKCWLHAVSTNLLHWRELEPAFWEESLGSGVQSGTCVVDYANTSGLSPDPKTPPLIAFWSRFDNRSQCLSYSLDRGRTWKPHPNNPFMETPERDPKVFWHEPSKHWVMMLYGDSQYRLFTSTNLLSWKDEKNPLLDCFECPDFFELPVNGRPGESKWVLIQGNGRYSVGTFDGRKFTEESSRLPCDVGPHFYATQSWHNNDVARGGDGRRIQTAWMRGADFPDMPFSQMISFPCELTLHATPAGLRLRRQPIREIGQLHRAESVWNQKTLPAGASLPLLADGQEVRLRLNVAFSAGAKLVLNIRGAEVVFSADSLANGHAPASAEASIRTVELLVDRTSIEAFANDGAISSTRFFVPNRTGITARAVGGTVTIESAQLWRLASIWK